MTRIHVLTETDQPNGWRFEVKLADDAGSPTKHVVTLSWQDYDLWSRGAARPERVVTSLFTFLLQHEPKEQILREFDAAVVRRYFPEVDKRLPGLL
ncbi:MAG: hypothetical protein KAS72_14130 [Phycisphaerales bacterium]|nr:hypothetical protein [Phycisphaerales bacterium]